MFISAQFMVQNVVHGDIPSYQTKMNLLEDSLIVLSFIYYCYFNL